MNTATKARTATHAPTYDAAKLQRMRLDVEINFGTLQALGSSHRDARDVLSRNRQALIDGMNSRSLPFNPYRCPWQAFADLDEETLDAARVDRQMLALCLRQWADLQGLQARVNAKQEAHSPLAQLVSNLDQFVRDGGRGLPFAPSAKRPPADLAKTRAAIAGLRAERVSVENAPPSREERRARIVAHCENLAQRGAQRFALAVDAYALTEATTAHHGGHLASIDIGDILAAVLGPEAIAKALCEHAGDAVEGIGSAERAQRLATIDAELLALEHDEETAVERLEASGAPVTRRPDASPAVVLRVAA